MRRFIRFAADRYLIVPIGAVIAVVWANTLASSYFRVSQELSFAVNDIGMAFALAFLAQEVAEATLPGGTLHSWRQAVLPVVAAGGGVVGAVAAYVAYIRFGDELNLLQGWPIVCAVDVTLCYLIATSIFRHRAPITFVLLLAIASDAVGLLIVSYRYPSIDVHPASAALILVAVCAAACFRRGGVRAIWPYALGCGALSWMGCYRSGVHPALALLPIVPFFPHAVRDLNPLADPAEGPHKAAAHFESVFKYPVQAIAFLFGLVNAGVLLRGFDAGTWATMTAAIVGRPVGMLIGTALGVAAGLQLPRHVGWRELVVIALIASSSVTFGLFMATTVFPVGPLLIETKLGAMFSVVGIVLAFGTAPLLRIA